MPSVTITKRGEQRVRNGHPWIYKSDVVAADAAGGDLVAVVDPRGQRAGYALYSDRSEIALRMFPAPRRRPICRCGGAYRQACEFRTSLGLDATACRLVHGEADLLPGLVVDRYGDYLVVQALAQATDRMLPEITALLVELLAPAGILARNDPRVRLLEGLEQRVEVLHGTVPETIEVREGPVVYDVDPYHGQKTGLFLDQRENRSRPRRYAHGRVLDAFSYNGGFALTLAPASREVVAVDISEAAVERIRANAARNGITNVEARAMNVFDELRELERRGERFDTIVLDPPAFAKNKAAIPKALSGYKEINLRALKLLSPGGFLITCSCSYNVSEAAFAEVIAAAAIDAHADVTRGRKADAGPRPSGADDGAGDVLFEVLHFEEAGVVAGSRFGARDSRGRKSRHHGNGSAATGHSERAGHRATRSALRWGGAPPPRPAWGSTPTRRPAAATSLLASGSSDPDVSEPRTPSPEPSPRCYIPRKPCPRMPRLSPR